MITWIRQNAALFAMGLTVVGLISHAAVSQYQLLSLVAGQPAIGAHIHDHTRHIDPMRDGMSQKHLVDRLERLEAQVIRMERRLAYVTEERRRRERQP